MKLISSILVANGTVASLNCTGPVFTITCMPDLVIGVSVDAACLAQKYGLYPSKIENGYTNAEGSTSALPTCTACLATSCGADVFYNDSGLTGQVSDTDGAIYFQAGQCSSEMVNDVDNSENFIFTTQIGSSTRKDDSLGIIATNSISPIQFACRYSRNLDPIGYTPVGMTLISSNGTET